VNRQPEDAVLDARRQRALAFQAGGQARADGKLSAERLLASRCRPPAAQIDRICDRRARPCGAQASAPIGGDARRGWLIARLRNVIAKTS